MNSLSASGRGLSRTLVSLLTLTLCACGGDEAATDGGQGGVGGTGGSGAGGSGTGAAAGVGGAGGAAGVGGDGGGGQSGSGGSGGQGGVGGTGGSAGAGGNAGDGASGGAGGSAGNAGTGGEGGGGTAGTGGTATGGSSGAGGSGGVGGSAGTSGSGGSGGSAGSGGTAGTSGTGGTGGTSGTGGSGGTGGCDGGPSSTRHTKRPLGTTTAKNGYWEYLPPSCGSTEKPPLMVFLQGIGANGSGSDSDLDIVATSGPAGIIQDDEWPATRPFIVLSPQHGPSGCPGATEIHDFIAYGMANYDIDATRVYLTGYSCGAMGSANYLAEYAGEQVVAAVLIAGRATPMWNAQGCALVDAIGLWAFHGDADNVVSIDDDNTTMPKFIACPSPPRKDVQYTVYPGVGHESMTRTYDLSAGHDIYAWFLGFKK